MVVIGLDEDDQRIAISAHSWWRKRVLGLRELDAYGLGTCCSLLADQAIGRFPGTRCCITTAKSFLTLFWIEMAEFEHLSRLTKATICIFDSNK